MDKYNSILNREDYDEQYLRIGNDITTNNQIFSVDSNRTIKFTPPLITDEVLDVPLPVEDIYNRISAVNNLVLDSIVLVSSNPDIQKFTPLKISIGKIQVEYSPVNEEFIVMNNYQILTQPKINLDRTINCNWTNMRTYGMPTPTLEGIDDCIRYDKYIYILWRDNGANRHVSRFNMDNGAFILDYIPPDNAALPDIHLYLECDREEGDIIQAICVNYDVVTSTYNIYNLISGVIEIVRSGVILIKTKLLKDRLYIVYDQVINPTTHRINTDIYLRDGDNSYIFYNSLVGDPITGLTNDYVYASTIHTIDGNDYIYNFVMDGDDPETIRIERDRVGSNGQFTGTYEIIFENIDNILGYPDPLNLVAIDSYLNELFLGGSDTEHPNVTLFIRYLNDYLYSFIKFNDRKHRYEFIKGSLLDDFDYNIINRFANTCYYNSQSSVKYISLDDASTYRIRDRDIISTTLNQLTNYDSKYYIVCKPNISTDILTGIVNKSIVISISESTREVNKMYKLTVNFGERIFPFSIFSAGFSNIKIELSNTNPLIDFELYQYIIDLRVRVSKNKMQINPSTTVDEEEAIDPETGLKIRSTRYIKRVKDNSVDKMMGLVGNDFNIADFLNIYTTK